MPADEGSHPQRIMQVLVLGPLYYACCSIKVSLRLPGMRRAQVLGCADDHHHAARAGHSDDSHEAG